VCAFCFTLAFFCLLCGLVLDGFRETVRDQLAVKREWHTDVLHLAASAASACCMQCQGLPDLPCRRSNVSASLFVCVSLPFSLHALQWLTAGQS
jgi:hypothetical protein